MYEIVCTYIIYIYLFNFRTDKAVFIYMDNMSLHFNDYEEKSEKNAFEEKKPRFEDIKNEKLRIKVFF